MISLLQRSLTTLTTTGLSLTFLLAAVNSPAEQQLREIVLTDGSIIHAKVLSLDDGLYQLDSDTLGKFKLKDEDIAAIRKIEHQTPAQETVAGKPDSKEEIENVQTSLLSNPGSIAMIFKLQDDPEIQAILQDKEVMALVLSGNLEALQENEKFIKLMNNPKIQKLLDRTKQ